MKECLEKVGDNRLVIISKVDSIYDEINAESVDEIRHIVMITIQCDQ